MLTLLLTATLCPLDTIKKPILYILKSVFCVSDVPNAYLYVFTFINLNLQRWEQAQAHTYKEIYIHK
jgi:hypothetical protein